ncbi:MAG: BrnT family toxin [Hyphomicrobiaceae bacterium]|nr:BrnT family toxin [Hyphomicrobiaceae bacterium]
MSDTVDGDFEWDEDKNRKNIANHGISFEMARRIFESPVFTREDDVLDYEEIREISIGMIDGMAVLVVIHTDRNERTRLISARPATSRERKRYEREIF